MIDRKKFSFGQLPELGNLGKLKSVGLTEGSIFDVNNSPLTEDGTIDLSLKTQSAFTVFSRGSQNGVPSFQQLVVNHIPTLPISKIENLQNILNDINNSGYIHPTQNPINIGPLSGPSVISAINVNNLGHVTSILTRNITLQNLGGQPAGNYELVSNKANSTSLGTSNSLYPTQNAVKVYVDNLVAAKANISISINAGSGLAGGGNLSTNRTLSVDSTVVRTNSTAQVKTGAWTVRRGSNSQKELHTGWDYPDDSGEHYNLRLYNSAGPSVGNTAVWDLRNKFVTNTPQTSGNIFRDFSVYGIERGVLTIGAERPSANILTEIATFYSANNNTQSRFPISLYVNGIAQVNNGLIVGSEDVETQNITSDVKLFVEGNTMSHNIRTILPGGSSSTYGPSVKIGTAINNTSNTVNRIIGIELNGVIYDILARVRV